MSFVPNHSTHIHLHTKDRAPCSYGIETLCTGANEEWKGWKVTRRYRTAGLRDEALKRLRAIETSSWDYRAARAK